MNTNTVTTKLPKIIKNMCRCKKCGDVIESKHCHDWVSCKCGAIFTDGGRECIHRGWKDDMEAEIEDMTVYAEEK